MMEQQRQQGQNNPSSLLDAGVLLSHVTSLEEKVEKEQQQQQQHSTTTTNFGHRKSPELQLCTIPIIDNNSSNNSGGGEDDDQQQQKQLMVLMAVTDRCVSAQLWNVAKQQIVAVEDQQGGSPSSSSFNGNGSLSSSSSFSSQPVEVLVVDDFEDVITCTTMVALENLELAAPEQEVVVASNSSNNTISLMSGSVMSDNVNIPQRVAVIVGTSKGRVVSVEFSIPSSSFSQQQQSSSSSSSLMMIRRKYHVGSQLCTYLEPLPKECLLPSQQKQQKQQQQQSKQTAEKVEKRGGKKEHIKNKIVVPFAPKAGVSSIIPYSIPSTSMSTLASSPMATTTPTMTTTYVWIGFGDGCAIRMNHAAFFSSVVQKYTDYIDSINNNGGPEFMDEALHSFESIIGQPLIKIQAHLPLPPANHSVSNAMTLTTQHQRDPFVVLPLPKSHPTPFAITTGAGSAYFDAMSSWTTTDIAGSTTASDDDNKEGREYFDDPKMDEDGDDAGDNDLILEADWYHDYEAVVYNRNSSMVDSFPTIAFFTSEDQYTDQFQSGFQQSMGYYVDEEKKCMDRADGGGGGGNPIAAIVGGIFGIFHGGSNKGEGGKKKSSATENDDTADKERFDMDTGDIATLVCEEWDPLLPFPTMNRQPVDLCAGVQLFDPPRQIRQLSIAPTGDLAAFSDSLGRVSLIDLSTKQVVRMWKGYREATVSWCTLPRPNRKKSLLFLVIHSRQRRIVEVWQTTHGPLLKSLQVGREAQVITSRQWTDHGEVYNCYIASSTSPSSTMNSVDRVFISFDPPSHHNDDVRTLRDGEAESHRGQMGQSLQSQDDAIRMNRLKQLLGETNVTCESADVYVVLQDIQSLEDLAISLDMIARSPALEEEMAVEGSTFQRLAISHCQQQLDDAVRRGGDMALTNRYVAALAFKIAYYTQVCNAYDALRRYETRDKGADSSVGVKLSGTACSWGLEAAGWTSTYYALKAVEPDDKSFPSVKDPLKFYQFASCLVLPKKPTEIDDRNRMTLYLSDSSRTRMGAIDRIFDPLTSDVFSFSVVNQVFDSLGIGRDHDYKLKCFGEWFMSLSLKEATKKTVFAVESPAIRWLKEIISDQLEEQSEVGSYNPMESLYKFCVESEDILRAFWLGSLCHQAVQEASLAKEEKSYGKIDSSAIVKPWDEMLRKLRVCMLVSLRLRGNSLGTCPISIKAVEADGNFSVYQWLAMDELNMSHKQAEILSLEIACRMSNRAFDPSKPEGDDPARWKMLQRSCLSVAPGERERAEYMIDFDDDERLGALHLYFKPHNRAEMLVAHRALLLASQWGHSPSNIDVLSDAIAALEAIDVQAGRSVAFAVRLEVWQSHIRPIYRSVVAGFHGTPEISPEIIGPLVEDSEWLDEFSKHAAHILQLVADMNVDQDDENINQWEPLVDEDNSTWPPVRDCFLLKRYVKKNKPTNQSSLKSHQAVIYALRISNDSSDPSGCIPSFYDLFTPSAIFSNVATGDDDAVEEMQHKFMQDSILHLAKNYHGPALESLNSALGDINVLAQIWDFDATNVTTLFLLAMYEYGKDAAVDDLLTKSASMINTPFFVDEGVDIIVRRLHHVLHVNPREEVRNIIPALDADFCAWVEQKAIESEPLSNANFDVKVGSTHLFGLRLLSLAASADVPKEIRRQIHSLIVLSGTIVKALETSPGSEGAHVMASPSRSGTEA
jgi:Rab3 GTPase-activating protein regulatory subunit N-terminus